MMSLVRLTIRWIGADRPSPLPCIPIPDIAWRWREWHRRPTGSRCRSPSTLHVDSDGRWGKNRDDCRPCKCNFSMASLGWTGCLCEWKSQGCVPAPSLQRSDSPSLSENTHSASNSVGSYLSPIPATLASPSITLTTRHVLITGQPYNSSSSSRSSTTCQQPRQTSSALLSNGLAAAVCTVLDGTHSSRLRATGTAAALASPRLTAMNQQRATDDRPEDVAEFDVAVRRAFLLHCAPFPGIPHLARAWEKVPLARRTGPEFQPCMTSPWRRARLDARF